MCVEVSRYCKEEPPLRNMKYSNPLCDKMNGLKFKVFVIDHFGSRSRMPVHPTVKNGGSKDSMSNSAHIKLQSYYPKGG